MYVFIYMHTCVCYFMSISSFLLLITIVISMRLLLYTATDLD